MNQSSSLWPCLLLFTLSMAGCVAGGAAPGGTGAGGPGDARSGGSGGAGLAASEGGTSPDPAALGSREVNDDPKGTVGPSGAGAHGGQPGSDTVSGGSGGTGAASGSAGLGGDAALPATTGSSTTAPTIPARIRRLTNAEYDASVRALLGTTRWPSVEFAFPPDARQGPSNAPAGAAFTVNDAQRVDPVLAGKLDAAAQALVGEARASGKLAQLAPCPDTSVAGGEACAAAFLRVFGELAYRRPLTDDEVTQLVLRPESAYHVGADGYSYEDGIDLLTRIVLQAPAFLYLTELGDSPSAGTFELAPNEVAAAISYLLTSGPPDSDLLATAAAGQLGRSAVREAEARRLLATPAGRERMVRFVREWLGVDEAARREKAQSVYPEFAQASAAMENESRAFIESVLYDSSGTLTELLTADWTIAEEPLAAVYGLMPSGTGQRTSLTATERRGILTQGAFLSVFATNNGSHPVFRGVAILRRLACLDTPDPGALGLVVSFPASDATKTTRERFAQHASDPACAVCHTVIDGLGFAFESFDGMGRERTVENGVPIDTAVTINAQTDFDGTYRNSMELIEAMASSPSVQACLARQLFRSSVGRSDESIQGVEDSFVELWRGLPADRRERLVDVLVAYVGSPSFVQRRPE